MTRQTIRNRWTGAPIYEGDFATLRECVKAALMARADLAGANLTGAYLTGANLTGANLTGAIWRDGFTLNRAPVRTAQRADGYTFYLLDTSQGWRIAAGCRFFTPDEAWKHWLHRDGTPLGDETFDILTMFELAMERGA
jgi:hypothetical protein